MPSPCGVFTGVARLPARGHRAAGRAGRAVDHPGLHRAAAAAVGAGFGGAAGRHDAAARAGRGRIRAGVARAIAPSRRAQRDRQAAGRARAGDDLGAGGAAGAFAHVGDGLVNLPAGGQRAGAPGQVGQTGRASSASRSIGSSRRRLGCPWPNACPVPHVRSVPGPAAYRSLPAAVRPPSIARGPVLPAIITRRPLPVPGEGRASCPSCCA